MRASLRGGYRVAPWLCLCLMLATLPVPAAQVVSPESESEKALKERAQVFWATKVKEDYDAQYRFIEPKVRRRLSLTDYIKQQGPLQYLAAHVDGVQADEARGVVTVRIRFQLKIPRFIELPNQEKVFEEEWVRRGGEWYRVFPQG